MERYDIAVIGAGPGGYTAAIRAAQLGACTAVIEREFPGGTCLNWGCIPTKTLVASAKLYHKMLQADGLGLTADSPGFSWEAIQKRKTKIVKKLRQGIKLLLRSNDVSLIEGTARLMAKNEILVAGNDGSETSIHADAVIIATGSESACPGFIPFESERVMESKAFLDLTELPKSIIIVGGGIIGCEFAGLLNTFGISVTVVEMLDRLLPLEDEEISVALTKSFKKAGITVMTGAGISDVTADDSGVRGKVNGETLSAEMMLVAVGRSLNTHNIGLETVGIATDTNAIAVDDHMRTSIPGIYAIGDITNKPQLAHVASAQALVAAENAAGKDSVIDYRVIPNCIFTIPEIATVGLNEAQARESAGEITVGSFPYAALGKAMAAGETNGFYKIIADAKTDEILGVQIYGSHATDIIAEATLAIKLECTAAELGRTIHAHPTLAEGLMEAAHAVHGECIHLPKIS
jgi:dihydrolipoamide dehydrogenase